MVTILLANGFEVAEALVTLDLLHRAGVEACLTRPAQRGSDLRQRCLREDGSSAAGDRRGSLFG